MVTIRTHHKCGEIKITINNTNYYGHNLQIINILINSSPNSPFKTPISQWQLKTLILQISAKNEAYKYYLS